METSNDAESEPTISSPAGKRADTSSLTNETSETGGKLGEHKREAKAPHLHLYSAANTPSSVVLTSACHTGQPASRTKRDKSGLKGEPSFELR